MNDTNDLTYKDDEGKVLYGFSQQSLDQNTRWLKLLVLLIGFMLMVMLSFLFYLLWLTNYIMKNDVLGNILRSI